MNHLPKSGDIVVDKYGKLTCMAYAAKYVMARRPSCHPFVMPLLEWWKLKDESVQAAEPSGNE